VIGRRLAIERLVKWVRNNPGQSRGYAAYALWPDYPRYDSLAVAAAIEAGAVECYEPPCGGTALFVVLGWRSGQ
jgi:hypothetical protein